MSDSQASTLLILVSVIAGALLFMMGDIASIAHNLRILAGG